MTEFKDVNVGDKVRLTHREHEDITHTFVVAATDEPFHDTTGLATALGGFYFERSYTVEVLEPAPKPLPTEDGVYITNGVDPSHGPTLHVLYRGHWRNPALAEQWRARGLQRLVPESEVTAARDKVVKEIVKFLYRHDDRSWDVAANKVDLEFNS